MLATIPLHLLIAIFFISSFIVWIAGVKVTQVTDIIDCRFRVGQIFGGLVLLSFVTNLPEIAIVIGGALTNNIEIITGNLLGGIAIQTVVLVVLDAFGLRSRAALTYKPISLQIVLEGLLLVLILLITILGSQFPKELIFYRFAPGDVAILITWISGLWLIKKSGRILPWKKKLVQKESRKPKDNLKRLSTPMIITLFVLLAIITLITGVILEVSSTAIVARMGWNNIVFGATVLAFVTALPEISTGLAAVKMHEYTLAFSDIFGGNAFLPTLFMLATLLSGTPVLSQLRTVDIYLSCLSGILTIIYLYGLIFSSKRQIFWLGLDSIFVLIVYILGIVGLFFL